MKRLLEKWCGFFGHNYKSEGPLLRCTKCGHVYHMTRGELMSKVSSGINQVFENEYKQYMEKQK